LTCVHASWDCVLIEETFAKKLPAVNGHKAASDNQVKNFVTHNAQMFQIICLGELVFNPSL